MNDEQDIAFSAQPLAGLCSVAFRTLSPAEILVVARKAGVEAIEWGGDVHVLPGDGESARKVSDATAEAGLHCASYGSYLYAGQTSSGGIRAVVETAAALGAPNVRIWTDWVGSDPSEDRRRQITHDVRATAAAAADWGMTVSLEFHAGTLTETAASTCRLLEEADAPNLYSYWQPADGVPVANLLEEWRTLRNHVSHLHVFRWRSFEERWSLADGADLWPLVFADLPRRERWNGRRVAFIEFVRNDDPSVLVDDARVLHEWLSQVPARD